VHDLDVEAAHLERLAIGYADIGDALGGLFAKTLDGLGSLLALFDRSLEVLRRLALRVQEEPLLAAVEDDLGAGGLPELVGATGVVEVVVREEDVSDMDVGAPLEKVETHADGLLVAEAAVHQGSFAAVVHEKDVGRLGSGIERGLGWYGDDV
jgi:hypothetical protein